MTTRLLTLGAAAVLFAAGAFAGLKLFGEPERAALPQLEVATYMPAGRPLQDFELIAADGGTLRSADLQGDWTVLFMGFTNCGHVCPMTLFTVGEAVEQIEARPNVLFVSVDPARDTPEVITRYLASFDAQFLGATGEAAQLDRLAESLGAPYLVSKEDNRYIVDHSGALFVIDPAGRFRALLSPPHDANVIAADLKKILAAA